MRNMNLSAVSCLICIFMTAFNVVIMTEIEWTKYKYNAAFADYRCFPNDTVFEKNGTYGFLTCGKICHFTTKCVSFFYQPDNSQCIGCRGNLNEAEWINCTEPMPGSLYFSDHDCPPGKLVVKREHTCYSGGPFKLTFHDAANHCEKIGAHLVQAETYEENTFLKSLFNMTTDGTYPTVWQGLTDIHTEGIWQWYSPQVNSSFADWADGELKNTRPDIENCAVFHKMHDCDKPDVNTFCEKKYIIGE